MNPFYQPAIDEIAGSIAPALGASPGAVAAAIELPRDTDHGDFALPCFRFAKEMKKAPPEIARTAAAGFRPGEIVERVQQAGPFLNFFMRPAARAKRVLTAIHAEGVSFALGQPGHGRTVVIDLSSPNIAKPFHIGHLRSTVIGTALGNLFDLLGYRSVRINHLGDWGTQFGRLMVGWQNAGWRDEAAKLSDDPIRQLVHVYVKVNQEMDKDPVMEEQGRAWFAKLEKGDPEAGALWKQFRDLSLAYFEKIYRRLNVRFDEVSGESFYTDKMGPVIERARATGAATESKGALVIAMDEESKPPVLLLKSDGATTYHTRDLAAAIYRQQMYSFEKMLYVVGQPQRLHFEQLFEALAKLGYAWSASCHHVSFGHIHGMSTRKGQAIWLEDVLEEAVQRAREKAAENPELVEDLEGTAERVGIGAIVFHDFMARRIKDLDFDWDAVLNFHGESGPYVQYSHVRTWGILRKAARPVTTDVDWAVLADPEDRRLLILLETWPARILAAAEELDPSIIARYLLDLSGEFHSWLQKQRVLGEDEKVTAARLLLVDSVRHLLGGGLALLGVAAPEKM